MKCRFNFALTFDRFMGLFYKLFLFLKCVRVTVQESNIFYLDTEQTTPAAALQAS